MNALDVILAVIVSLFVVYLIVLAASEPRYTWQPETLDEMIELLRRRQDEIIRAVGEQVVPIFERLIASFESFGDRHDQP